MKIQFYRHKEHKDLFLTRSNVVGGTENARFYLATKNWIDAYKSLDKEGDNFLRWLKTFPNIKVDATLTKIAEFDGYKGELKKDILLNVSDFELVTLAEEWENDASS